MTKKHIFCRLLNMAFSMALWTKVITCDKAGFKSRFCQVHQAGKIGVIPCNLCHRYLCPRYPRLIKELCACKSLYNCRDTFTDVMSALQIHFFMQNKAKFQKVKLNVNKVLTRNYEQLDTWSIRKKQSQTNPNKANFKPNFPTPNSRIYPASHQRTTNNEQRTNNKQTQFQTEYLLAAPILHNYLPVALFPLTSVTSQHYNRILNKISCFGERQMKGFGNG